MPSTEQPGQAVPNFFHAESGRWYINVTSAVCLPIIFVFACLRFYSKFGLKRKLTWDDLTCTLGIASGITFIAMCLAGVAPVDTFTKEIELRKRGMDAAQLRLTLVLEALYGPFVWFIKLSLFVIIIQVFNRLRWVKLWAIGGAVFTGLFYFSAMIALPILCAPRTGTGVKDYTGRLGSGACRGSFALGISVGAVSVASDLYLILLPLPAVWSLHLPLRRRFAIAAMFFIGIIALVASTVSLVYRVKVYLDQGNVCSFNILPNWLFAIVEMAAGIVVCCMPAALLTFNAVKPHAKSLFSSSSHYIRSRTPGLSSMGNSGDRSNPGSASRSQGRDSLPAIFGRKKPSTSDSGSGLSSTNESEKGILPRAPPPAFAQWMGGELRHFMWDIERAPHREGEASSTTRSGSASSGDVVCEEITALPKLPDEEAARREREVQRFGGGGGLGQGIWKTDHIVVERGWYR